MPTQGPKPTTYRVALSGPLARKVATDRAAGHRLLMSMLPNGILNCAAPRAHAQLLWRVNGEDELLISSIIKPESHTDANVEITENRPELTTGTLVTANLQLETTYTPAAWVPEEIWNIKEHPPIRNKRIPVPTKSLKPWITEKLSRNGFTVTDLKTVIRSRIRVNARTVPVAEIQFQAIVYDTTAANKAMFMGLGRSKSYGCGMIQIISNENLQGKAISS